MVETKLLLLWAICSATLILSNNTFFETFQGFEAIQDFIQDLPDTQIVTIGQSVEKRNIDVLQIGNGTKNILITGGMHSREWVGITSALYIARFFTSYPEKIQGFTLHIIPLMTSSSAQFIQRL